MMSFLAHNGTCVYRRLYRGCFFLSFTLTRYITLFSHVYNCYWKLVCIILRYEILEVIGKGSFGQVIRALDHKTGQHIAIKIIRYAETQVQSSREPWLTSNYDPRTNPRNKRVYRQYRHPAFIALRRVISLTKQHMAFHCPCRNKKRFHHQALIEVRILEHLRKKDLESNSQHNVIHMLEYFYFRNHLCISFELMRWAIASEITRIRIRARMSLLKPDE